MIGAHARTTEFNNRGGVCAVQAGLVTGTITVRAVVLSFATVDTVRQPATLEITEEDIRKGFVDQVSPSLMAIKTNSRKGCVLALEAGESPFKEVDVTFQGRAVFVGRQGELLVLY